MKKILSLDLGSSSVKALVMQENLEVVGVGSAPYPTHSPAPGWVEQDPDSWWPAAKAAARQALDKASSPPGEIVGIGLSGHMSGLVLIDKNGRPLLPCITVFDTRTSRQSKILQEQAGDRIRVLTGNPCVDAFMAPKLLWAKMEAPQAYNSAHKFIFPKDYLRMLLTGEILTEPTDAGNSLFLNPTTRSWDTELFSEMGFNLRLLPEIKESCEVSGYLGRDAAFELGLTPGIPVVCGAADMACSAIGTGIITPGVVAITLGTSAQVVTLADAPAPAGYGKITFHPHAIPGFLYAMGSPFTGGLGLEWISKILAGEGHASGDAIASALSEAESAPPGCRGVIFLPFLVGAGTPYFDPGARAGFLGLATSHTRGDIIRSVLEGIAFNIYDSLKVFQQMGISIETLNVGAGGMRSPLWRQIIADVCNIPLRLIKTRDASAAGAAAIAMVGLGLQSDLATLSLKISDPTDSEIPDPEKVRLYARLYGLYERFYLSTKDVTKELTELSLE